MTFVIVQNTREGDPVPVVPSHPSNLAWVYEMIFDSREQRAYADSFGDLVAVLIDGYADFDGTAKADARIPYAHMARLVSQTDFLMSYGGTLNDADQAAASLPPGEFTGVWQSELPLVLVTSDYAPYTSTPQPSVSVRRGDGFSSLAWIDVSTDEAFIESLHTLAVIVVNRSTKH